ncbi:sigma-54-dependent transcriptional regulator [Microscilla marina]|uniref:Sigma-54 dependent DNA-binding response regulator, Fis family n=1 Tax=Microscilla marina ATCC 23134 TaxID=313606 RepID=A1ZLC8_MICM2|nr:sigma-54 dependent transcriptional regulator [Microscilla marina]EAY28682.1 sigma-54 dependent DNA-binding response regulator, Fis family [Microscilla marina ATCC 23134]
MAKQTGKILVVDDDQYVTLSLRMLLEQYFKKVEVLNSPKLIPEAFAQQVFDVVLLDMNFSPGETSGKAGIKWLEKIIELDPNTSVILMTAYGAVDMAVQAIKDGAVDFVVKPFQNEKLLSTVTAGCQLSQSKKAVKHLRSQKDILSSAMDHQYANMIGRSAIMQEVFQTVEKVAQTDANVLILGENGTGKELIARAVHRSSARAGEVFISVDLGAVSETLFESELFGHKKGAFTDAKEDRVGRFEAASGGTLFLDEIGNLSLPLQAKLLAVLQNRQVVRVGSNQPIAIDIRLVCATNMNLTKMVKEGTFRQDLLYRINTIAVQLPALRERNEDIPLLAEHFLKIYCKKYQKPELRVPEYVVKKLQKYQWPGNVRELQHALERAVILSDGVHLKSSDFQFLTDDVEEERKVENYNLEDLEKWAIKNALVKHKGNVSHAAKELGLTRGSMYRRMEKYGL